MRGPATKRTKTGHLVEPRLPEEIRSLRGAVMASRFPLGSMGRPSNLEKLNFLKIRPLRLSIHNREGGKCFYCLRRIPVRMKCNSVEKPGHEAHTLREEKLVGRSDEEVGTQLRRNRDSSLPKTSTSRI